MRILITGSRTWQNKEVIHNAIRQAWIDADKPYEVIIVHGAAPGADRYAAEFAQKMVFTIEAHEADWSVGKRAGYIRNKAMVDAGADICLAFIRNNSRGATMCADLANKAGIPVEYYREDSGVSND